jgi:adenylosuccinate synthase
MPIRVVVGCQWGDEGKGKIVDLLARDADWVARFQGGANAGHTVLVDGRTVILHLVPSGILQPGVSCAIGNGVVLDPEALLEEIRGLEAIGIDVRRRLRVSASAHLVTPLHRAVETLTAQDREIGTTGRGIGPAYAEKASRRGLRVEDLLDPGRFDERLRGLWERFRALGQASEAEFAAAAGGPFEAIAARLLSCRDALAPLVCDVTDLLLDADDRGERILCEGAQGAWLDLDHGTYPFVTSSSTTTGGACIGLGIPPRRIARVIGVVKAYTTRVGRGPFPTEFSGTFAESFRDRAGEYGATTRRPRRCGWFDAVLVRRSCRVNGVDELVVTKLDILSGMEKLRVAIDHRLTPASASRSSARWLEGAEPVYRDAPGWSEDLGAARAWDDLPPAAADYVRMLGAESGVPVGRVSLGPGRDQVVAAGA